MGKRHKGPGAYLAHRLIRYMLQQCTICTSPLTECFDMLSVIASSSEYFVNVSVRDGCIECMRL